MRLPSPSILHTAQRASLAGALALLGALGCGSDETAPSRDMGQETTGSGGTSASTSAVGTLGVGGTTPIENGNQTGEGECTEGNASAELVPTNLLFVVDKSGSMNCNAPPVDEACQLPAKVDELEPSKWESTQAALVGADDEATPDVDERGVLRALVGTVGLSAGLITFPIDNRCQILPKGELTTDIVGLDTTQADALASALELVPEGETPLAGAAIRGLDILRARLVSGELPGNGYLVLMTDGVETCQPTALDDLKTYVTQALESFGIRTYVIGAPGSAESRALLSEIAHRGGTASDAGCAHGGDVPAVGDCHIDLTESDDFSGDLAEVFSGIANSTQASCDFDVPEDAFVDPDKVNVIFTASDGREETFFMDDRDCDTQADGWQYTSEAKEKIVLCGNSCARVRVEPGARVRVVFRCLDTEVR